MYDVCVCGAGPAGLMAALASVRFGVRTLLLEKTGFPGGLATGGLVGPISKFNFGGRRIVSGIPWEFVRRLYSAGGAIIDLPSGNVPFDAEIYKLIAGDMLETAGVQTLFHATVYDAECDGDGRIRRVLVTSEGNRFPLEAAVFIDCTGTGSLISVKPEFWRRRNCVEANQPLSLVFILGGVETSCLTVLMAEDGVKYAHRGLREELTHAVESRLISGFGGPWAVWGSVIREGQVSVNCTRYAGDVTDPFDFSRAETKMRSEIMPIIDVLRQADAAFAQCFLQSTAFTAGYRESRELAGLYRVTEDDVFSAQPFPDTIAFGGHPVDRHLPGNSGQAVQFLTAPYAIPYACLVSRSSPNLLAAGALACADPGAFATMRVQAQCMAMGQAAGTAAALSVSTHTSVQEISREQLRGLLTASGAIV